MQQSASTPALGATGDAFPSPEKQLDHTTRAYIQRRKEERAQRRNALIKIRMDNARAAEAERNRILAEVAEKLELEFAALNQEKQQVITEEVVVENCAYPPSFNVFDVYLSVVLFCKVL